MATIKDVAKTAGVSVATASNALNGKRGVNARTRETVFAVAGELRYSPNVMAKGLVTGSFETIGLVLSSPPSFNVLTNQSILRMIQTIAREINEAGYAIMLNMADFGGKADVERSLRRSRQCDGIILIDTRSSAEVVAGYLSALSIPAVVALRASPLRTHTSVGVDNVRCGYIATKHLIDNGHRRIAYVGRMPGVGPAEQRLEGYQAALRESGIVPEPGYCLDGDHYQESGRTAAETFLRIAGQRPTAVVVGNDLMALGVVEVLQREGIPVPEAVSIVGCDNLPNMHMMRVPLTSVDIPFEYMGHLAAKNVLDKIRTPDTGTESIVLQPELRIRASVRALSDTGRKK
jgi:LacI family transcriptional regulator